MIYEACLTIRPPIKEFHTKICVQFKLKMCIQLKVSENKFFDNARKDKRLTFSRADPEILGPGVKNKL